MKKTLLLIACISLALSVQAGTSKQDNLTVRTGRSSWSQSNGSYSTAGHGWKFVFVDVSIVNNRSADVYVNPTRFELIDSKGGVYDWTPANQNGLDSVTLRSGTKTSGKLAFKIPYNAKPKRLIFKISYDEEMEIRL